MVLDLALVDEKGAGVVLRRVDGNGVEVEVRVYVAHPDHVWTSLKATLTEEDVKKMVGWLINVLFESNGGVE